MPRLPNHLRLPATRRFQSTLTNVVARATPKIQSAWDDLDSIDEESVAVLTAQVAPTMHAVKSTAVRSAVGYYTILAGVRRSPAVPVADIATAPDLRAPFISVWQALASGVVFAEALNIGRSRIEAVVSDFAVSAARQTGGEFVSRAGLKVSLWERIPDGGACDWCVEVADNVYHDADTADFGHDRCQCSVAPLFD